MELKRRVQATAEEALENSRKAEFVGEKEARSIEINRKIRERYSLSDEIALLRKALMALNIDNAQLNEYCGYVEECKREVDKDMARNSD